LNLTGS